MTTEQVLEQLSSLKDICEAYAEDTASDLSCLTDATALETAITMISALQDEGVNNAEELRDWIFDCNLAAKQNKELHRKFEVADKAISRDGVLHCPECNHRVAPKHSHCHWCGKKLGGW